MNSPPFSSILIANRGEIAIRIIRTCKEMGIRTVAVFSTADAMALHVQLADDAYCIGPPPATESYLSIEAILQAAADSGAEAVHPGYGFLAENATFAQAVQSAGLVWIGPPPHVMALMGDKVAAKELARSASVPVVPGYDGQEQTLDRMTEEAAGIGYPVMLKAAAGGGGKGMRAVWASDEMPAAFQSAKREAMSAFGNDQVFLEKLIVRPRHVETQLLFDDAGSGVYLGERDCSLQRRHQKVIEEAPSPALTRELRGSIGDAAIRLARAGGYVNAGTVEFLYSGDEFFFLEMNTRIQVEHPVTEMVTGLDLIRLQIEIASGKRLDFSQLDIELRGHAIEARIYAEDPNNQFLPATGSLVAFSPPLAPGVRNDVGCREGSEVPPYYDPMLAKLIVHAPSRAQAVQRMQHALEDYVALGIKTNLNFLHWIVMHPDFQVGRTDIAWLESSWSSEVDESVPAHFALAAAAFLATRTEGSLSQPSSDSFSPWGLGSGWRSPGMESVYRFVSGSAQSSVFMTREMGSEYRANAGDGQVRLQVLESVGRRLTLQIDGKCHRFSVVVVQGCIWIASGGIIRVLVQEGVLTGGRRSGARAGGRTGASAPMPGTVVKVTVEVGQVVAAHEPLLVLEAMKMEHVVEAPRAGTVRTIFYREGDLVPAGSAVVEFEET